jgi:beta-lactamase class A
MRARSLNEAEAGSSVSLRLAEIERRVGGRLGVAALDTSQGASVGYRADERFPMCSTFKLPLVAAVLSRVDAGQESLSRRVVYDQGAVLEYAPVAARHVAEGLTVEELCAASITVSDNTTANLLLETLGGPAGLTAFFRRIGDDVSRLDRNEPLLNTAIVGDERDTTTPRAMLTSLRSLLLTDVLSEASRDRLIGWLEGCSTGSTRLRAGLPNGYRVGDKTGTGQNGATNDVAIAWPPHAPPLLIAAYSHGSSASSEARAGALAEVARSLFPGSGRIDTERG